MNEIKIERQTNMKVRGKVRCQVVDSKTRRVKRDYGWQKNLILNQGLEMPSVRQWVDCFTHATVGTGTTPTQDDSGTTTANQVGTTVTLAGGSFVFNAGNVGAIIKWDTNEEARILTYTSPTQVEVVGSASVSAAEFTLYRANQTGMATETAGKRTNTYLPGAGNSETTFIAASGIVRLRRTFDYTPETGSPTYTEVGLSYTLTVAANLFSRILLNIPIAMTPDDQLRLIYELEITVTPNAPRAITPTITGWTSPTGSEMVEHYGLGTVSTTGQSTTSGANVLDPIVTARVVLSNSSVALSPTMSVTGATGPTNRNGTVNVNKLASTSHAGSGTLRMTTTKQVTFLTSEGNMVGIRSICLTYWSTGSTYYYFQVFLLDAPQDKDNAHSLNLQWRIVWSRTLS